MREALDAAMRVLANREHSAHQLRQKLKQRGFSANDIDEALVECARLGLQSDTRFAESLCRMRIERGYGPLRLALFLQEAGVSSEESIFVLETLNQTTDWVDVCMRVWQKKYGVLGKGDVLSWALQQKHKQFLRYRGFTDETIRVVFETYESCHEGYE